MCAPPENPHRVEFRAIVRDKDTLGMQQIIQLERTEDSLIDRIDASFDIAVSLFPGVDIHTVPCRTWIASIPCVCEVSPCQVGCIAGVPSRDDPKSLALAAIPLPSNLVDIPNTAEWTAARRTEEELRVGQMNEALEELRLAIGRKSYLYRTNRELATGKRERTRNYDTINSTERSMRILVQRYDLARGALRRLNVLDRYPEFKTITRLDTKAVTAIYNMNAAGQSGVGLSWIWSQRPRGNMSETDYLQERKSLISQSNAELTNQISISRELDPCPFASRPMGGRTNNRSL